MTEVHLKIDDITQAYFLLDELKQHGYVVNRDFEWSYFPTNWDYFTNTTTDRGVTFAFKDDTAASWFLLKYASRF